MNSSNMINDDLGFCISDCSELYELREMLRQQAVLTKDKVNELKKENDNNVARTTD